MKIEPFVSTQPATSNDSTPSWWRWSSSAATVSPTSWATMIGPFDALGGEDSFRAIGLGEQRVVAVDRLVRQAEAEEVVRHDAVVGGEIVDDMTPVERRAGEAMEDHDRRRIARAAVDGEDVFDVPVAAAIDRQQLTGFPPFLDRCGKRHGHTVTRRYEALRPQPMGVLGTESSCKHPSVVRVGARVRTGVATEAQIEGVSRLID